MSVAVSPSADEFIALARGHGVVPVARRALADLDTPLGVYVPCTGIIKG
jgi:anthranilate synthase component 1